ncbi:MAG: MFS transporter [Candidatus Cloacimonadota bacterium]|nr:MFS transporter [Candidatus Cloacimonadota bacterium]
MGNILSLYVVVLVENSQGFLDLSPNEILGITAGITGIAMTAIVFPAGYLTDKLRRDKMLRAAGIIGTIAMIILALALDLYLIMIALFLWGVFQGISRPAFESIVADSLPTGNRSGIYSKIHLVRQFGMASGPVLNILLFFILGDQWDIGILRSVMLVGVSISLLSSLVLFLFKDDRSMGHESESIFELDPPDEKVSKQAKKIPILLVTSNVIIGMGAGMTVKFFPVFFRAVYTLKPISVQMIMGATFIVTGIAGIIAQKFSVKRGRGEMIFAVQFLATMCLVAIGFYPPLGFLVPLFVLRGSLMNAAQPLSRSILMDVVPKKNRGKWNSLEAIAWGLFWNASAVLGGFLIGDNNFKRCFLITAGIYFVGTIPILLLIPMVKKETA